MSSKADNNAIDFVAFYLAKKINEEKTFKKMYIYKEKHNSGTRQKVGNKFCGRATRNQNQC